MLTLSLCSVNRLFYAKYRTNPYKSFGRFLGKPVQNEKKAKTSLTNPPAPDKIKNNHTFLDMNKDAKGDDRAGNQVVETQRENGWCKFS